MPSNTKDAIHYHSLEIAPGQTSEEESLKPEIELGQHPQLAAKRSWTTTFLVQLACLLWLAPVVTLLVLNFKGHVVGASAWCPNQNCQVGWFNIQSIAEHNLYKFDRRDHNLIGVLQLVAKALEIWFELIAVALVYLITFMIAGKKEGLSIGFMTRPNEFSDFVGLFDPLMWKIMPPLSGASSKSGKNFRRRVYLFIGPATAVLVIPSLQWLDTKMIGNATFGDINSSGPPLAVNGSYFWMHSGDCTEADFSNKSFSCSAPSYASNLDEWLESYHDSSIFKGMTQQDTLTLGLNQTFNTSGINNKQTTSTDQQTLSDIVYWSPNRQLISTLSNDQEIIAALSKGYNESIVDEYYPSADGAASYAEYDRAVKLLVQRKGPAIGAIMNMWADWNERYHWTAIVDDDRSIRCFNGYSIEWTPLAEDAYTGNNYTKCIRLGSGWSADNKHANFSIGGAYDMISKKVGSPVAVNIYSSDKAAFLEDQTFPSWLPADCLANGYVQTPDACDYDRLFLTEPNNPIYNRSMNVNTIEFMMSSNDSASNITLMVDYTAQLNASVLYQLDPSPLTNPLYLVQTADLPPSGRSIHIDPAWSLAAWSADNNGVIASNRTASLIVLQQMSQMLAGPSDTLYDYWMNTTGYDLDYISLVPIMQTLSLIDYTTTESSTPLNPKHYDPIHPALFRNAKMYVWAYGMTSRTAILGATVAIAGVLIVLVQFVLGFVDRRRYRSPTQLLVAALEHVPEGEFAHLEHQHDEVGVAKVKFHVKDLQHTAGKFGFRRAAG